MNTTSPYGHLVQALKAGSLDMSILAELAAGSVVDLPFAVGFATADAAVLGTMPAGAKLLLVRGYWEVTADWTGGASSAIGLSSSQVGNTTKGDLLGGAAGDLAAGLTIGVRAGTIGADIAGGVILLAGATVRFDRIVSNFATGAGYAHLVGIVL